MSGIGPELPPHLLAKRKRQQEESERDEPTGTSGAKDASSPEEPEKRRRVIGPVMPPAPLEERPPVPAQREESEDSSDDDDDLGPAVPTNGAGETTTKSDDKTTSASWDMPNKTEAKPQRDEWMMMPPKQDDLAARMDPTRQRPRGFNTGKSARGPSGTTSEDASSWNETPEQKQKRLANEMMGVTQPTAIGPPAPGRGEGRNGATAAKIREHTEKVRGPSLMEQHKSSKGAEAADDDPSARAFDREKDMAGGMRIGHSQRQQMLKKASDYSSKFSGGGYL